MDIRVLPCTELHSARRRGRSTTMPQESPETSVLRRPWWVRSLERALEAAPLRGHSDVGVNAPILVSELVRWGVA